MTSHDLSRAKAVADDLLHLLAPHCERIAVAGSIRRKRPQVKDIELLCASKVTSTADLFGRAATKLVLPKQEARRAGRGRVGSK